MKGDSAADALPEPNWRPGDAPDDSTLVVGRWTTGEGLHVLMTICNGRLQMYTYAMTKFHTWRWKRVQK
jgi:hypothetical protein